MARLDLRRECGEDRKVYGLSVWCLVRHRVLRAQVRVGGEGWRRDRRSTGCGVTDLDLNPGSAS